MTHADGKKILRRLLLRDVSAPQLAVYAIGVYLGLLILAGAMQLWRDFSTPAPGADGDPLASGGYVIFSPHVEGLGFGAPAAVADTVLDALRRQSWAVMADRFTASDFSVAASVDMGGGDVLATALFFESVPDDYLHPLPAGWTFDPADPSAVIPVIVPRDYLALYNFGFAPSRGLPSLGEEVIMQIPLSVSVAGRGRRCDFPARIAGFSTRVNTIVVPESFLSWANDTYGGGEARRASRLIARVTTDASDPAVRAFAASHSLDISGDDGDVSPSRILAVILSVVMGVGVLLCVLSVVVLTVSLFLLLYKSREVIVRLIALGFRQRTIVATYSLLLAAVNSVVFVACAATLAAGHRVISPLLSGAAVGEAPLLPTVAASLLLMILIQSLGMAIINMKTRI